MSITPLATTFSGSAKPLNNIQQASITNPNVTFGSADSFSPAPGSLKDNMDAGHAAVRDFRTKFGKPRSNTWIAAMSNYLETRPVPLELRYRLGRVKRQHSQAIGIVRRYTGLANNSEEYFKHLLKFAKCAANCGECASITSKQLQTQGYNAKIVAMVPHDKSTGRPDWGKDHAFVLLGLKPGANIENPKTWGDKAVIVDSWAGLVIPAREGLEYFTKLFKVNPDKQEWKFEEVK